MSLIEQTLRRLRGSGRLVAPQSAAEITAKKADAAGRRVAPVVRAPPGRTINVSLPALRAAGLLAPEDEAHQLAHQYRQIKRPLIVKAIGRGAPRLPNGQVIMVASAIAGEGKTFTAINLALSMSIEKDVQVLLVDADVAKPHISRLFGEGNAPGLLDVLRDARLDVESLILPTDVPNLSILPAGTHSREATELLASARMQEVMRAIAGHDERRLAVFDSPPLLLTTESHALAQVAGQVVLVVRADSTPRQAVLAALSHLGEHPAVSLVLNQCTMAGTAGQYYGGYADDRSGESSGSGRQPAQGAAQKQ